MPNIFLSSDLHLGHEATCSKFKKSDGSPLQVFDDVTHMNEYIVMQHNRVVGPNDKWYCLGDIAMSKKFLPILHRMNGEKILIRGNHDIEDAKVFLNYFKDVRGSHQLDGMLLTHIPVHPSALYRWKLNIHGHLHDNVVMKTSEHNTEVPDDRYFNVCMEKLDDYTPISLEQLKARVKNVLDREVKI